MRCDNCGREIRGGKPMPDDWPLDWWSHKLAGLPCPDDRAKR